jgi:hypothetical protein
MELNIFNNTSRFRALSYTGIIITLIKRHIIITTSHYENKKHLEL